MPKDTFLSQKKWKAVVQSALNEAKKDSNFIFKGILPQADKGKMDFHFSEPAGQVYQLKLLSRRPDSLQRIDIIPTSVKDGEELPIQRKSEIVLREENGYYTYTFDVAMLKEYDYVQLFFEQFERNDAQKSDLILMVYRK